MPKSQKPKKPMTPAKKAIVKAKSPSTVTGKPVLVKPNPPATALTVEKFIEGFRIQFAQFERIAQTVDSGLPALAQEVMIRSAWLWAQGDDMTREKYMEACGEVYDKSVEAIAAYNAKRTNV